MRKSTKLRCLACAIGSGLVMMAMNGPACAGDVILFRAGAPSPDELAGIMFPKEEVTPQPTTRGLRFSREPPVAAATSHAPAKAELSTRGLRYNDEPPVPAEPASQVAAAQSAPVEGDSVGFNITFALGSAELEPESRAYLDSIGRMLAHERPEARVAIAGHADARGDAIPNMRLSQRRAEAVREYLWGTYGIAPDRMAVIGYGESRPLAGTDPYDGVNRRVEFQPLS